MRPGFFLSMVFGQGIGTQARFVFDESGEPNWAIISPLYKLSYKHISNSKRPLEHTCIPSRLRMPNPNAAINTLCCAPASMYISNSHLLLNLPPQRSAKIHLHTHHPCLPFPSLPLHAHLSIHFTHSLALLSRSPDLWIQPHEMVVDGILLARLRSLFPSEARQHGFFLKPTRRQRPSGRREGSGEYIDG